jgi:hypothetical protein
VIFVVPRRASRNYSSPDSSMTPKDEKEKPSSSETRTEPHAKKRRESSDEFCKRLGIRTVEEKGGREFLHGTEDLRKKPKRTSAS